MAGGSETPPRVKRVISQSRKVFSVLRVNGRVTGLERSSVKPSSPIEETMTRSEIPTTQRFGFTILDRERIRETRPAATRPCRLGLPAEFHGFALYRGL